ncbi:MAG: LamG-like jellyroll fold domain-containing protein [Kiritimatiellia bacterium]
MKTILLSLCLVAACCGVAPADELLWADFDAAPTGSVAALPGWTRAAWLGGITGRVADVNYSHSPSNVLELPWNSVGSSAVFTNFNSTYNPADEHPVVRCSAKLVAPSNAFFQLGLRNSTSGAFLSFQPTNNFGGFGFLAHDLILFPLVHDRFVDVTFFYNRSNNHYRCDYNYTNQIPWITNGEGVGIVTQFNQFVVSRPSGTASTTGSFLVDDVSVETFPPYAWAWWRCTAEPYSHFVEQLGAFRSTYRVGFADSIRSGSSDPIWDGAADFRNAGSIRQLIAGPTEAARPLPATTNWTLETALRMPPDADYTTFFDWGAHYGFNATSAWIQIGYNSNGYVYANLRDAQQGNDSYAILPLRSYAPNGRWQHLAVVKSNAQVFLYVDYQFVTNRALAAEADGSYAFATLSQASIGRTLNNGNFCGPDTLIDEVRFSTQALVPAEFLQPGQPLIVDIDNSPTGTAWQLTMKGILGKSYRLETSSVFGPGANWQASTSRVADYVFNYIDVPTTVPRSNFVRLVREN